MCSGNLQFPSWITWSNHRVDPLQSLLLCSAFSIFFLHWYYYIGFNTFNQAWITLWHYEGRSNLENGPFWNIKCPEITWTRLNLHSYSPSWCTDGQRVIMDSREIMFFFKKWSKIEEESYKALNIISHHFVANSPTALPTVAGPPQNCLYFSGSACQTPRVFLHAHPPSLKAVPKHTTWCGCVCVCVSVSEKIRPHERCFPGDTSGIPGMLLGSCADFWDHSTCTTSCPSLLFWDTGRHTMLPKITQGLLHEWALAELWSCVSFQGN